MLETFLDALNNSLFALFSQVVQFLINGAFVLGQERSDEFIVYFQRQIRHGVQQRDGNGDPDEHIGELIEKNLEERSNDFS